MSKPKGKQAFLEYYHRIFPSEELFNSVIQSLESPSLPVLVFARQHEQALRTLWEQHHLPWRTLEWYPHALYWPSGIPHGTPLPGYTDQLFYPMNASSLLPAIALTEGYTPGEFILDACAAPGGKTIVLADRTQGECHIIANDPSRARRSRLHAVLQQHTTQSIELLGRPAETLYKTYPNHFDRILADVPCSSEKHVYSSEHHLNQWGESRITQLQRKQIAIASGLFEALKVGGRMIYSTCAITPQENEVVIETLLKKKKHRIRLVPWNTSIPHLPALVDSNAFAPDFVTRILPHAMPVTSDIKWDPMFVAIIEKTR